MESPKTTPKDVTVENSEQIMRITWADGEVSEYPLHGLRKACPCVMCKGGHEKMGDDVDPNIFKQEPQREWKIEKAEAIGNHALKITWNDGHDTGMYRWEYLRMLSAYT